MDTSAEDFAEPENLRASPLEYGLLAILIAVTFLGVLVTIGPTLAGAVSSASEGF